MILTVAHDFPRLTQPPQLQRVNARDRRTSSASMVLCPIGFDHVICKDEQPSTCSERRCKRFRERYQLVAYYASARSDKPVNECRTTKDGRKIGGRDCQRVGGRDQPRLEGGIEDGRGYPSHETSKEQNREVGHIDTEACKGVGDAEYETQLLAATSQVFSPWTLSNKKRTHCWSAQTPTNGAVRPADMKPVTNKTATILSDIPYCSRYRE